MFKSVILNEAEVMKTWGNFITESTGVTDRSKLTWMSKYCAFHNMHEQSELNESVHGYAHLNPNMNVGGMGAMSFPGSNPNNGYDGVRGSGDNPFSLLPLAVQVAAQTIALDLVPVVPMQGPLGILQYMDYVYEGGRTNRLPNPQGYYANGEEINNFSGTAPLMVKIKLGVIKTEGEGDDKKEFTEKAKINEVKAAFTEGTTVTVGEYTLKFIAFGRIDGNPIFQVIEPNHRTSNTSLAESLLAGSIYPENSKTPMPKTDGFVVLDIDTVKALEDFIPGYTGAGYKKGDMMNAESYDRATGESTPSNMMSLNVFTQEVKAKTIQVKGTITREQIQDLKAYGIDALAQVEAELVNELTQHINRELLNEIFTLGRQNYNEALAFEGINLNTFFTSDPDINLGGDKTHPDVPEGYKVAYVGGGAETLGTIQRRIMSKILAASNLIAQRGRRGAGTFAVCSAHIATALQDCAGFVAYPLSNTINQTAGSLFPVGAVAGVSIYVDPNMPWSDNKIVVGRKGKDNEPGIVFMPYLMADKLSYPSEGMEGAPVTSLKSRYAIVKAGHHPQLYYYTFSIATDDTISLI